MKRAHLYFEGLKAGVIILTAFLISNCTTAPPPKEEHVPVFYPPLPNPPRIQYLKSFSSAEDLRPIPGGSFAEFVIGKRKEDVPKIRKPYGVAFFKNRLYVVDTRGGGYAVFDLERRKFKFVRGSGGGRFKKPINITIDSDGTKYITDTGRNQVLAFDRGERFIRAYGVKGQFKPGDVVVVGNRLYVSDLEHFNIHILDKITGKTLFTFGKTGLKDVKLVWPTNMALGPDGNLYVTDTGNFQILKYSLDGKFLEKYGMVGTGLGQFARPKGIALDRKGRIYVVDAAFENIQIFDPKWRLLLFFGEPGASPENINLPAAIVIDYESVPFFQKYAHPKFKLEYVIAVTSQFGRSKVNIFGFGKMEGMDYSPLRTERSAR
jgi:sugar lactone lactonase YvrE